jgi:hypothetical protein
MSTTHLSVDLETYSDIDIKKCGLYKYTESPNFQIMLVAYSLGGQEVQCLDLFDANDALFFNTVFKEMLLNPDTIITAHNANFEAVCLARHFNIPITREYVSKFRCSMIHALYCGYPASLDAVGKALGLPQDKQKLNTGKALIRYFCVPTKPTKTNGGRTRNLPHHDPERWNLFKQYCEQDVTAEMAIEAKLAAFPVPDDTQKEWVTDIIVNTRGIAVDRPLVKAALDISNSTRAALIEEAARLSGLNNPNSIQQLSAWLEGEIDAKVPSLDKETVSGLLDREDNSPTVQRMLQIRQELGKTSTKKYTAIENAVCSDGRVRGLLQFYGANRTGRWCLTGDHEVLTPDGWVRLDKWQGGEIACWSMSSEYIFFQGGKRVAFDYTGKMYSIDGPSCAQISTPEHRMAVRGKGGHWKVRQVKSLKKGEFIIPSVGRLPSHSREAVMSRCTGFGDEQITRIPFSGRVYCAETPTGFFLVRRNGKVWVTGNSGRLVQTQNLPRTYIEPLAFARELVKERQPEALRLVYGSLSDTLSQIIRTCFVASPGNPGTPSTPVTPGTSGRILIDADFSAIEARVISWLAGEQWRLEVFRTHGKIYEASASQMFGVPIEKIVKGNPEYALRQKGKVAELACGYGGGVGALVQMGALEMGLMEEELPGVITRWREANKRIRDLWYALENAAIQVITEGGSVRVGHVLLSREVDYNNGLDFMTIQLPSGRKLYYAKPTLGVNRWGKPSIEYQGLDQTTKQWGWIETYGGKCAENCTQAIARDCLAVAIERLEAAGYAVVMGIHDEVVIDAHTGTGTKQEQCLEDVVKLMAEPMPWAADLPLDADGWTGEFFRKE